MIKKVVFRAQVQETVLKYQYLGSQGTQERGWEEAKDSICISLATITFYGIYWDTNKEQWNWDNLRGQDIVGKLEVTDSLYKLHYKTDNLYCDSKSIVKLWRNHRLPICSRYLIPSNMKEEVGTGAT